MAVKRFRADQSGEPDFQEYCDASTRSPRQEARTRALVRGQEAGSAVATTKAEPPSGALPWRWSQEALPCQDRFQVATSRAVPAKVATDRVRPEPVRADRSPALRETVRSATSSGRSASSRGLDTVVSGEGRRSGSTSATLCRCARIPVGTMIHNIELKIGKGGQMVRSAGAECSADGEGG